MTDSPTLTPNALESLLRDLDREAFVAFVADLWSAGGWETERTGPLLTAARDGETRRILVWTDDRNRIERLLGVEPVEPEAGTVDAVVTRRRDGPSARRIAETRGARVIDTAGLHDRLLYAIGRARARELCRTHFGSAVEPRPPRDPDGEEGGIEAVVRPGAILVAAVLLALAVAVGAGLSGQTGGGGGTPDPGETESGPAGTPLITPVGAGEVTGGSPTPEGGTSVATRTDTGRIAPDLRPTAESFAALRANASTYRNASFSCPGDPGRLVEIAVGAIRFNDPDRNDGLRTVWRLAEPGANSYETFEAAITSRIYRPLFTFDRVAFESRANPDEERTTALGTTTERVVVVGRNGSIARYEFRLRYVTGGCWKIDQIFWTPIGDADGDSPETATSTATPRNGSATEGDPPDGVRTVDLPFAWYDP